MPDEVEKALQFTTDDVPDDPVSFTIDGERFDCLPLMTGAAFIRYSRLLAKGGMIATGAVEDFFSEVMDPEEHKRFRKFIEDPGRRITTNKLGDIFLGLFGRYAAGPAERSRPTEPPKPSRSGRARTRGGSKAKPSSPGSTSKP